MEWLIILLPVLLEMLEKCINTEGPDLTKRRLKAAGPGIQWALYRAAKKGGASRPAARQFAKEVAEDLRSATDEELNDLIAEATNG